MLDLTLVKETFERLHPVSVIQDLHTLRFMLSTSSFKSNNFQASRVLLIGPQCLADLISKAPSNILQAIRCSIDFGCC